MNRFLLLGYAFSLPLSIAATQVFIYPLALSVLIQNLRRGSKPFLQDSPARRVGLGILIYLGTLVATSLLAESPLRSFPDLQSTVNLFVFFPLVAVLRSEFGLLLKALLMLLGGMVIVTGYTLTHHFYYLGFSTPFHEFNPFVNALTYSEQLVTVLLLALPLSAYLAHTNPRRERWILSLMTLLLVFAAVYSRKRGPWLGALSGIATFVLLDRAWLKNSLLWAAAVLALVVFLANPFVRDRAGSMAPTYQTAIQDPARRDAAHGSQQSTQIRLGLWKTGWRIFRDHPWMGVGPGHLSEVYYQYRGDFPEHDYRWSNVHNTYLQTMAESGILGLAGLLSFFGLSFAALLSVFSKLKSSGDSRSQIALGCLGALSGFAVLNLTETALGDTEPVFMISFVLAAAASLWPNKPRGLKSWRG